MQDPIIEKNDTDENLILGLDIGVASVGWCLKNEKKGIVAMGVRMFSPPEIGQARRPAGQEWRTQRLTRRTLRRRRERMEKFRKIFGLNLSENGEIKEFRSLPSSPWELRVRGLAHPLSREEWLSVLYHILRHRGPKISETRLKTGVPTTEENSEGAEKAIDNASAGEATTEKNSGRAKKANDNAKVLSSIFENMNDYQTYFENSEGMKVRKYRTPGEYIATKEKFKEHKRNRPDDFLNSFPRSELRKEIVTLFAKQREIRKSENDVPSEFSEETENRVLDLFDLQRSALKEGDIDKMVGSCTFEWDEKRSPQHAPTYERFMILCKINSLRIIDKNGEGERMLRPEERKKVIDAAMASHSVTYGKVRMIVAECLCSSNDPEKKDQPEKKNQGKIKAMAETIFFVEELRNIGKQKGKKDDESPEEIRERFDKKNFVSLPGRAKLAKALGDEKDILDDEIMDEAVRMITLTKDEDALREKLANLFRKPGRPDAEDLAGRLSLVSLSKFGNLSVKAMKKMIPFLEKGSRYDEAAKEAGYSHFQPHENGPRTKFLPPIPKPKDGQPFTNEMVNNPVVYRALNQSRRVVNAIIKVYGPLSGIRIETAREIAKTGTERMQIEREQAENRKKNEEAQNGNLSMTGKERMKRRLYDEQIGQCLYTGEPLDINASEIDHIYPRSRSMDDSYMNKVLVTTTANREKGDSPLWEYLKCEGMEQEFRKRVTALKSIPFQKRRRLLDENPDFKGMTNADLSNTRYATRYFLNFINAHLLFANNEKEKATATNGRITSLLRHFWGLSKNRDEDDCHHALDAAVIAFCDQGMVNQISAWFKWRETFCNEKPPVTAPKPYENKKTFRDDLMTHISRLRKSEEILISRAVRRLGTGEANKDTILSVRDENGKRTDPASGTHLVKRVSLVDLQEKDLENLVGKGDPRNAKLYEEIGRCLVIPNKKGRNDALSKIRRNVTSGPLVKSVKIIKRKGSGFPLRGGWTINRGRTIRTDVFRKDGKFYLVPVYVSDIPRWEKTGSLPMGYVPFNEKSIVDENFEFVCSLYQNDLVKVKMKRKRESKEDIFGYFDGIDVCNATVKINHPNGGKHHYERPCVENAISIEKFSIDILGRNRTLITGENRRGLEIHSHRLSGKDSGQKSSD